MPDLDRFLSTPSVGRATQITLKCKLRYEISIHALRGEGDWHPCGPGHRQCDFYPRPPWGGRRFRAADRLHANRFLSTPSVGRATAAISSHVTLILISIHALRGEGDWPRLWRPSDAKYFYPRPPWGGRRGALAVGRPRAEHFYPRPPWGGRRGQVFGFPWLFPFLSTPSVGRATALRLPAEKIAPISIHALRGEGDGYRH